MLSILVPIEMPVHQLPAIQMPAIQLTARFHLHFQSSVPVIQKSCFLNCSENSLSLEPRKQFWGEAYYYSKIMHGFLVKKSAASGLFQWWNIDEEGSGCARNVEIRARLGGNFRSWMSAALLSSVESGTLFFSRTQEERSSFFKTERKVSAFRKDWLARARGRGVSGSAFFFQMVSVSGSVFLFWASERALILWVHRQHKILRKARNMKSLSPRNMIDSEKIFRFEGTCTISKSLLYFQFSSRVNTSIKGRRNNRAVKQI